MPTDDLRPRIDVALDRPAREALTGTAPASIYRPLPDAEQLTVAPDGRPIDEQPAWRADFPIDWPQDHYVERRDFMKFMVLTSLAFTVGQFSIAVRNWWRRRLGQPEITRVAAVVDVPLAAAITFAYPGPEDDCILVRTADDRLVAYGQECTHLSCAVQPRLSEGVLRCPCHEGYFELTTGRPVAGPPRRPLPLVRLEVRGGEIYATGVEVRTA